MLPQFLERQFKELILKKHQENREELLALLRQGLTVPEIVSLLGVSKQAIYQKISILPEAKDLKRQNALKREQILIEKIQESISKGAKTWATVASEVGSSITTVSKLCRKYQIVLQSPCDELIGQTFGHWTIISRGEVKEGIIKYICICNTCNENYQVTKRNLIRGLSKSCKSCSAKLRSARHKIVKEVNDLS